MGFSFNNPGGEPGEVTVQFYGQAGEFLKKSFSLAPASSWCITGTALLEALQAADFDCAEIEPVWYFARSPRADLTGYAAQSHLQSGHTSGEHSF